MGVNQQELARQLGKKSHVVIGHWERGRSKPEAEDRQRLSELFPIPITAWDEPPTSKAKTRKRTNRKKRRDVSAQGLAAELRELALDMLDDIRATTVVTQRSAVAKNLAGVIGQLAKIEQTLSKAFGGPLWTRVIQAVKDGCREHPEALKGIEAELRRVDAEINGTPLGDDDDDSE
jgi:transcriptional regulator with XRE-family HTH domain